MEEKLPRLSRRGCLLPLIGSLWSDLVTIIVILTLSIIILAMMVISNIIMFIIMLPNQVLMLATFTANLAAFLTVERMQTTIQNLEELARFFLSILPLFLPFALHLGIFQNLEDKSARGVCTISVI